MLFENDNTSPTHHNPYSFTYRNHHMFNNSFPLTCKYNYQYLPYTTTLNKQSLSSLIPKKIHQQSNNTLEIEDKRKLLISLVLYQRNFFAKCISHFMNIAHNKISLAKALFRKKIIILRICSVTLIQNSYKAFITRKHFQAMLLNTDALFLYDFKYSSQTSIKVRFKRNMIIPLAYSKYLQCYYLPIKKVHSFKRKIKVQIVINGNRIIDSRYPVSNDSKGNYYNVISTAFLFKKIKERSPKFHKRISETKFYEELFECKRKRSVDLYSVSNKSDISTELNNNILGIYAYKKGDTSFSNNSNRKILKSILKTTSRRYMKISDERKVKKVAFNNSIEVSY